MEQEKNFLNYEAPYPEMRKALKEGAVLHAFCSETKLRCVQIFKGKELLGYGQHPSFSVALLHAEEDTKKHLPYDQQYGECGVHRFHKNGLDPLPGDVIDKWLWLMRTIDVIYEPSHQCFLCRMPYYESENPIPSEKLQFYKNCIKQGRGGSIISAIESAILSTIPYEI